MSPETRAELDKLAARLGNLSANHTRSTTKELASIHASLGQVIAGLAAIHPPPFTFDPTDPNIAGRIAALVLSIGPREPLATKRKFWGAGVYALYYRGGFEAYQPLAGSEHPIYVGKASPVRQSAKTPEEQGTRLTSRLNDHWRAISRAANLAVDDFDYRALVVQSGFESSAESYLIDVFQPIWNSETGICYGIGKHGDSHETRANKRSPWDTLHPGRTWAHRGGEDARPVAIILAEIAQHLEDHPPYRDRQTLIDHLLRDLLAR